MGLLEPKGLTDPLFHLQCDGEVIRPQPFHPYGWNSSDWTCKTCGRKWGDFWMRKFSLEQLADRFFTRPLPDPEAVTLVEKIDGKVRYTALVKGAEASKYPKVVLP